nr:hypothetical protein [Tanacetum cinerariifolium]
TQEVGEDVARVKEYKGVAYGLKIAMQRREEYIGELKALGDCEVAVELCSGACCWCSCFSRKAAHSLLVISWFLTGSIATR